MKVARLLFIALAATLTLSAQKREIVELQREMAAIQEQVKLLQRSVDEKLAALTTLVQQSLESANRGNTSLAVLEGAKTKYEELGKALNSAYDDMRRPVKAVVTSIPSAPSVAGGRRCWPSSS